MDSSAVVLVISLILAVAAVAYISLSLRRRSGGAGVRSALELTPQDGWSLLNLVLTNHGDAKVWVERAAFVFTDLDADMQGVPASGHGAINIREFIRSDEDLRVSLIEVAYNAAGKPQGAYTFRLLGAIRYRVGDQWIESETPAYQIDMVRLSATRLRKVDASGPAKQAAVGTLTPRMLLGASGEPAVPASLEAQATVSEDLKSTVHSL